MVRLGLRVWVSASFQIFLALTAGGVLGGEGNCPAGELSWGICPRGEMSRGNVLHSPLYYAPAPWGVKHCSSPSVCRSRGTKGCGVILKQQWA